MYKKSGAEAKLFFVLLLNLFCFYEVLLAVTVLGCVNTLTGNVRRIEL